MEYDTTKTAIVAFDPNGVEATQVNIPALEPVGVPLAMLRAMLTCVSDDAAHPTMCGVSLKAAGTELRMCATDSRWLLVHSSNVDAEHPAWLDAGVIVPADKMAARLALLDKLEATTAKIAYATGAPYIYISDPEETTTYRVPPVDGSFPEYKPIFDQLKFGSKEIGDMASIVFDRELVKGVGVVAKALGSEAVRFFGHDGNGPNLVTFPDCPGAVLVLMPITKANEKELAVETARVLDRPVNLVLASLAMFREKAASKNQKRKVAEYDARIAAINALTARQAALPAPEGTDEPAVQAVEAAQLPAAEAAAEAEAATDDSDSDEVCALRSGARAKLRHAGRQKAIKRFMADVNARLSADNDGLTIDDLNHEVPIESWFYAGLRVEAAAVRCLEWRKTTGAVITFPVKHDERELEPAE